MQTGAIWKQKKAVHRCFIGNGVWLVFVDLYFPLSQYEDFSSVGYWILFFLFPHRMRPKDSVDCLPTTANRMIFNVFAAVIELFLIGTLLLLLLLHATEGGGRDVDGWRASFVDESRCHPPTHSPTHPPTFPFIKEGLVVTSHRPQTKLYSNLRGGGAEVSTKAEQRTNADDPHTKKPKEKNETLYPIRVKSGRLMWVRAPFVDKTRRWAVPERPLGGRSLFT